ncbi:MAG: pimeloyl-ACP methyl ester carboxylesterase [Neolewinella sp.]|jgi:pimeloyl-ACP methyl ester carboxylesterase
MLSVIMIEYQDIWYTSADGLRLYARDYTPEQNRGTTAPTILCMHGLTRNSADFEDICKVLADRYRLIVVDQRGRGLSDYDPDVANYNPLVYVQDMFRLLEVLDVSKVVLMGTSMGGIMAMMMATMKPSVIQGLIINDIGPEVGVLGLDRLKKYVGKATPIANWHDAAKQSAEVNAIAFPAASEEDWLRFAKRTYLENKNGVPVLAYDPKIAEPLNDEDNNTAAPNLWSVYDQICDKPMLLIRGELSDILEPGCVEVMRQKNTKLEVSEIPGVGHAPMLSEPAAQISIESFLSGVAPRGEC